MMVCVGIGVGIEIGFEVVVENCLMSVLNSFYDLV